MKYGLFAAITLSIVQSMLFSQTQPVAPARIASDTHANRLDHARISSTALNVRTTSESRVTSSPRSRSDVSTRVDSVSGATLYVRQPLGMPERAIATVAIPVLQSKFQTPEFSVAYLSARPNFGPLRGVDVVSRDDLERVAVHAKMREWIELGALFEGLPAGSALDTRVVHYDDGSGDVRLNINAERRSAALRDTVIQGRSAVVVGDSTTIALTHSFLRPSRLTAAVGRSSETLRGTIIGTRYVDSESQIVFAMEDTVRLTGTTRFDDGYGETIESPLVLESIRKSSVKDSLWQQLIPQPTFDIVRSAAPAERAESGDTASIVDLAIINARTTERSLTAGDVELLELVLGDQRVAFRTGVDREHVALNVIDLLLAQPPSIARGDERVSCTADACELLLGLARGAANSVPLRAVGLVAAMVISPSIWTDSVITYSSGNPLLGSRALWFAQGAATYAVASAKLPIPAPGSSYSDWIRWYAAPNNEYENWVASDSAMSRARASMAMRPGKTNAVTVSDQAALAVRFAAARTGLNYAESFRRALASATSDSARSFYQSMLIAMGDDVFTQSELVAIMLSSDTAKRTLAIQQIEIGFRESVNARDSTAATVGRLVVNVVLSDSTLNTTDSGRPFFYGPNTNASADSLVRYVVLDSLPASVRERAREIGASVMPPGWTLPPGNAGLITHIGPIKQSGAFVRVYISRSTMFARGPSQSGGFANGVVLTMVNGPDGWTIVHTTGWVT